MVSLVADEADAEVEEAAEEVDVDVDGASNSDLDSAPRPCPLPAGTRALVDSAPWSTWMKMQLSGSPASSPPETRTSP